MEVGENIKYIELQAEIQYLQEVFLGVYKEYEDITKSNIGIYHRYNYLFGMFLYSRYEQFCLCERLRRKLELYQALINKEEKIDDEKVESILDKEFEEYLAKLNLILEEYKTAEEFKKLPSLSKEERSELKRIYIKIAKAIHPDVNIYQTEEIKSLWQTTLDAYKLNDIDTLIKCELVLNNLNLVAVKQDSMEELKKDIYKYKEKVEIYRVKNDVLINSFPYNQKDLITNDTKINQIIDDIKEETRMFAKRAEQYEELINNLYHKDRYVC